MLRRQLGEPPPFKRTKQRDDDDNPCHWLRSECGITVNRSSNSEAMWCLFSDDDEFKSSLHSLRRHLRQSLQTRGAEASAALIRFVFDESGVDWKITMTTCMMSATYSVGRLLLSTPETQSETFRLACNHLIELVILTSDVDVDQAVFRSILDQFRWLDLIDNPTDVGGGLCHLLSSCTESLQRHVIEVVPEIADDATSLLLVDQMILLLEKGGRNVPVLLDALSSLSITSEQQQKIHEVALGLLSSLEPEFLTSLVSFIVVECRTDDQVSAAVAVLRETFDITSLQSQDPENSHILLQVLKNGISSSRTLSHSIVSALERLKASGEFKVIDFWLLLLINASHHDLSVKTEQLLVNKVKTRVITRSTFNKSLQIHPGALIDSISSSIVRMAQVLVANSANSTLCGDAAKTIYTSGFRLLDDTSIRQKILSSLVGCIGSTASLLSSEQNSGHDAVEIALDILVHLVDEYPVQVRYFSAYLQNLVDFVDSGAISSIAQLRKLFRVFVLLAYPLGSHENRECATFVDILVRKQLSHPEERYLHAGLIGGCSMIQRLCGADSVSPIRLEMARNMLSLCVTSIEQRSTEARQFFYDALDSILASDQSLSQDIIFNSADGNAIGIRNYVESEFTSSYLTDSSNQCPEGAEDWEINDAENPGFVIDIYPNCLLQDRICTLNYIGGLLRLLLRTAKYSDTKRGLESVDALLAAPLRLFRRISVDDYSKLCESDKTVICVALTHALNVVRELLNGFSDQSCGEMRSRTQRLLCRLIELEELLDSFLSLTPSYSSASRKGPKKSYSFPRAPVSSLTFLETLNSSGALRPLDVSVVSLIAWTSEEGGLLELPLASTRKLSQLLVDFLQKLADPPKPSSSFSLYDRIPSRRAVISELALCLGACIQRVNKLGYAQEFYADAGVAVNALNHLFRIDDVRCCIGAEDPYSTSILDSLITFLPEANVLDSYSQKLTCLFDFVIRVGRAAFSLPSRNADTGFLVLQCAQEVLNHSMAIDEGIGRKCSHSLSELAAEFLRCDWNGMTVGFADSLLRMRINFSESPLQTILLLTQSLSAKEVTDADRILFDHGRFSSWYSALFASLAFHFGQCKLVDDSGMSTLGTAISCFKLLCLQTRDFDLAHRHHDKVMRDNVCTAIKHSKPVVDAFVSKIDWIQEHILADKPRLSSIVSEFQVATRQLHSLCHFVKETPDTRISKLVPPLKKSLETLVFRMRVVLTNLGAPSAMSVGNLKFRDISGQTISAEIPKVAQSDPYQSPGKLSD